MRVRSAHVLFCVLFLTMDARAADPRVDILRLQDLRDARGLARYFADGDAGTRSAAAWAAGSVQDTSLIGGLLRLLEDGQPSVRAGAAFALGQTGAEAGPDRRRAVVGRLLDLARADTAVEPALRCVEAAGKLADSSGLEALAEGNIVSPGIVDWERALSVGRCGYRGVRSRAATAFVVRMLDRHTGPDRWKAAWALMRIGDPGLLADHADRLAAAAQSGDPDVRMFVAAALGKAGDRRVVLLTLLGLLASDPDWRVRVASAKALGSAAVAAPAEAMPALLLATGDSSEHVALAALAALGEATPWPSALREQIALDLVAIVEGAPDDRTDRKSREALIGLARGNAPDALRLARMPQTQRRLGSAAVNEALGHIADIQAGELLLSAMDDADPVAVRTACEALARWCGRERPEARMREAVREQLLRALGSDDPPVVATAADALADSLFRNPGNVPPLLEALTAVEPRGDAAITMAVVDALGAQKDVLALPTLAALAASAQPSVSRKAVAALEAITGRSHAHLIAADPVASDTTLSVEQALHPGGPSQRVHLRTTRGTITVELLPDAAPLTCVNFVRLMQKGFFARTVFHRVVPNFVVQGGDPRGDGWGGPGYAIRSEFGREHYVRGTIGMASSGKDTEGSQFFITHSRQPHLDGRYTIFGRVTDGMDVVDALQIGDGLLEVVPAEGGGRPAGR